MSRLRRLVLSDRYFFVTCNLLRTRGRLEEGDLDTCRGPTLRIDRVRIPTDEKARI